MIQTGEKFAVSSFMAGKVVPHTIVTANKATMPDNWRFMDEPGSCAIGKGPMVTAPAGKRRTAGLQSGAGKL
jgi:hypothetical protein